MQWILIAVISVMLLCTFAQAGEAIGSKAVQLHAGPVRMKLLDGELRYLYVGEKEVVRRIYFAVRDGGWGTARVKFSKMEVRKTAGGFVVEMAGVSDNGKAGFDWTGKITGNSKGEIIFCVEGKTLRDFKTPRIGLCVLVGCDSMAGRQYEVDAEGKIRTDSFPELVSSKLLQGKFKTLRYSVRKGLDVEMSLAGTLFNMEDQRTYGDTSYKAYAPMNFTYPKVRNGDQARQALSVNILAAGAGKAIAGPTVITIGAKPLAAKVPEISLKPTIKSRGFGRINRKPEKSKDAISLAWPVSPSVHLVDDDMVMENIPAVIDQARTIRSYAPNAKLAISPVSIHNSKKRDGRNSKPIALAWAAGMVKYAAIAGISEMAFDTGPGPVVKMLEEIAKYSGKNLADIKIQASAPSPVDALAIEADVCTIVWVYNLTIKQTTVKICPGADFEMKVTNFADPKNKPEYYKSTKTIIVELIIPAQSLLKINIAK